MKTNWKLITMILVGLAYSQPMAHSQSALEASQKIKERADAALIQYRITLIETAADPSKLHELSSSAEKCKGELQSLESEIDSQLDFLSKKEAGISSSGLAEVDRKELLSALASQKKPLSNLRTSNLAWKKIFEDFTSTTAKEWQDIYSSFSDIAGPEKAKSKLAERIKSYEAKLPWSVGTKECLQNLKNIDDALQRLTSSLNLLSEEGELNQLINITYNKNKEKLDIFKEKAADTSLTAEQCALYQEHIPRFEAALENINVKKTEIQKLRISFSTSKKEIEETKAKLLISYRLHDYDGISFFIKKFNDSIDQIDRSIKSFQDIGQLNEQITEP